MKKNNERNGKIEFLRFFFAICILLFHISKRLYGTPGPHFGIIWPFSHGCIGVEFFFLVSGWLLGKKAYDMRGEPSENLGSETYRVLRKKIVHIFPYHITATSITILVNMIFVMDGVTDRLTYLLDSWPSLLLLNLFGFESSWANKLTWYISAYLISTAILYPLCRRYFKLFTYTFCPLSALFILGHMSHEYGSLSGVTIWTGMFYLCLLRGFAEMELGIFAFHLTRYLNRKELTEQGRRILSVLEWIGYGVVFLYVNLKYNGQYEFLFLFILMLLAVLSFSDVHPMAETFNRPFIYRLGELSLVIYLNQFYVIRLVDCLMPKDSPAPLKIALMILFTFLCSIISDKMIKDFLNRRKQRIEVQT